MNQAHPLVYLARHGRTGLNASNSFRGSVDAPLDSQGWRDANQLKEYFSAIDLSFIFSSDKVRATSTANKIAEDQNIKPVVNPGLQALNVGYLSGKPKDKENLAAIEHYIQNPDICIPDGESLNEFKGRVRPLIQEAIKLACDCGVPVLIVAHSSVIHEVGDMLGGNHEYTLVEPGGVATIYIKDGKLDAEPIFRPKQGTSRSQGETIT